MPRARIATTMLAAGLALITLVAGAPAIGQTPKSGGVMIMLIAACSGQPVREPAGHSPLTQGTN